MTARTAGEAHAAMRALPESTARAIVGGGTGLILAPHPDDESLGCGGLIALLCRAGTPPLVAVLTDGAMSHPGSREWPAPRLAALREREAREALAILGLPPDRARFLGVPDTRAPAEGDAMEALAARLAALAEGERVTAVLGPWRHDPHCDHEAAAAIAARAASRLGVARRSYPVWGLTLPPDAPLNPAAGGPAGETVRGWRLDVSAMLPAKRAAVTAHRSQRGLVVTDDPDGFVLPPVLLDALLGSHEVFLAPDGPLPRRAPKEGKRFFFEKKKQKNFAP